MLTAKARTYANFVKLEHTIFSLPVVFAGAWLRLKHLPSARLTILLLVAAASARTVGMGFNRLVDAEIDARNPRTKYRELPRGAMTRHEAWKLIIGAAIVYLGSAALIAPMCLWLAPIPLVLFAGYPYLKRYTSLSHLGLGLAWSMGPVAGWVASAQTLQGLGQVKWLWLFSVLWVTGFDIIYSTMDEAFDRSEGLHALPARVGKERALQVAAVWHIWAFVALAALWSTQLHTEASLLWLMGIGVAFIGEHAVASRYPQVAFFHMNALVGFLVFGMVVGA